MFHFWRAVAFAICWVVLFFATLLMYEQVPTACLHEGDLDNPVSATIARYTFVSPHRYAVVCTYGRDDVCLLIMNDEPINGSSIQIWVDDKHRNCGLKRNIQSDGNCARMVGGYMIFVACLFLWTFFELVLWYNVGYPCYRSEMVQN